jgi:hypothetical protein
MGSLANRLLSGTHLGGCFMSDIKTSDEELHEKVSELLRGDYACNRVWEAWQVGTMTVDDFQPLEETVRTDEIVSLIQSEITAVLDRLQVAMERPITNSEIRGAIESERKRL